MGIEGTWMLRTEPESEGHEAWMDPDRDHHLLLLIVAYIGPSM